MAYDEFWLGKSYSIYLNAPYQRLLITNSAGMGYILTDNISIGGYETAFPFACYGVTINTDGLFFPVQYTTVGAPSAVGVEGSIFYDTTENKPYYSDGATWQAMGGGEGWVEAGADLQLDAGYTNLLLYPSSGTLTSILIDSDVAPVTDITHDFGGADNAWKDIYCQKILPANDSTALAVIIGNETQLEVRSGINSAIITAAYTHNFSFLDSEDTDIGGVALLNNPGTLTTFENGYTLFGIVQNNDGYLEDPQVIASVIHFRVGDWDTYPVTSYIVCEFDRTHDPTFNTDAGWEEVTWWVQAEDGLGTGDNIYRFDLTGATANIVFATYDDGDNSIGFIRIGTDACVAPIANESGAYIFGDPYVQITADTIYVQGGGTLDLDGLTAIEAPSGNTCYSGTFTVSKDGGGTYTIVVSCGLITGVT